VPLIGLLFEATPGRRWRARYALAALAAILAVGAALAVDRALVVAPSNVSFSDSFAMFDIAGVIRFTRPRSDDDLRTVLAGVPLHVEHDIQAKIRRRYKPRNAWYVTASDDPVFDPATTDAQRAALDRARGALIRDDPGAYLHHRWDVYRELLGLSRQPLWSPVFNFFVEYPPQVELVHHTGDPSLVQRLAYRVLFALAETPLYWAWLYAALAIVLLVAAARDRTSVALLLSGLLYELGYFPTAATPDFRYSHWMITATVIAAALTAIRITTRRRAARARPAPDAGDTPAASPRAERAPPDRG
jgi:hypothetical protein